MDQSVRPILSILTEYRSAGPERRAQLRDEFPQLAESFRAEDFDAMQAVALEPAGAQA